MLCQFRVSGLFLHSRLSSYAVPLAMRGFRAWSSSRYYHEAHLGSKANDQIASLAILATLQMKSRLIIKLAIVLLCTLAFSWPAISQTTVKDIGRAVPVGARAAALGDSYIAETTDAGDLFGNPATLSFLSEWSLFMGHSMEWKDEMMSENLALAFPSDRIGCFGLGVSVAHTGYIKDSPRASVKMRVLQYLLGVGYAQKISSSLGVGGNLGVRYVESGGFRATELTPRLGLFYIPSPEVSYGLVYSDQGSPLEFTYDSLSATWKTEDRQQNLQIGLVLRLHLWRTDTTLTMALANEKVFRVHGITYKGGIELRPIGFLAFRLAYFVTPDVVYPRFGIGLSFRGLRMDYAISPSLRSDRFHEMTAALSF
jgi:hypothetical protein